MAADSVQVGKVDNCCEKCANLFLWSPPNRIKRPRFAFFAPGALRSIDDCCILRRNSSDRSPKKYCLGIIHGSRPGKQLSKYSPFVILFLQCGNCCGKHCVRDVTLCCRLLFYKNQLAATRVKKNTVVLGRNVTLKSKTISTTT